MATDNGEQRVLTVFADVHYYFSTPTPRPTSHRFEKASYVYLYQRSNSNGGRLEIANNVGKPEQDAFNGALDNTTIRQLEQHRTLVTITVDGYNSAAGTPSPVQNAEQYWHLPNSESRLERKSLSRLHTLDIYFWTMEDANSFVAILRKILRPEQLDLPLIPTPQEQVMNHVVQKLENVAIQGPPYRVGQTRDPSSAVSPPYPQGNAPVTGETSKASNSDGSTTYQLLAYNPASPPAPEKIAHREKTPPPLDAETGTGLVAAAHHDQSHSQFSPASQTQSSVPQTGFVQSPGPYGYINPPAGLAHNSSYLPPPPPPPGHVGGSPQMFQSQNPSVSSSPYVPSSSPYVGGGGYPPAAPGNGGLQAPYAAPNKITFDAPPKDPHAHLHGTGPRPPDSPATEILGNSYIVGQPPLQHLQPQYADYLASQHRPEQPEGGYSNYQYDQPQHHHTHHSHKHNHNVHGEFYQPTEAEAHQHKHHRPIGASSRPQPSKVEKGIGRLLKKVEKTIG